MPKFKVRVINRETILTEGFIEVRAKTAEKANEMVDDMIENGEIYDDGTWEQFNNYNEVERNN